MGLSMGRGVYQRTIPLFITSFIIALLVVHYFFDWGPINELRSAAIQWANIVSLLLWTYSIVMLVVYHTRNISRGVQRGRRQWGESIVLMFFLILFIAFALSEPEKLDGSYLFQLFYIVLAGNVYLATESLNITHLMFNAWRRIVTSRFTPEIAVFLLTFSFRWFREMSLTVAIWPGFKDVGDWIAQVPYVASYRAITVIGAIGTLVIAVRALMRREAGIIEMERVQE